MDLLSRIANTGFKTRPPATDKEKAMKRLRVCIGSNDGETLARTHMGDTDWFYIYDLREDAAVEFVEKRANRAKEMEHAQSNKMQEVIGIVRDADIFVARQKSPNFVNIADKTKYQPVVVKADTLEEVLAALGRALPEIRGYVDRRRNGEVFAEIPEL